MLRQAVKSERVIFPCHNYKHAPVIKTVRGLLKTGRIGKVHLVTLQTFRNTHAKGVTGWRTDWRRERRFSGGGIAMDHGSHTFYLAFEWLGSYPTGITARAATLGPFDTEDDFACSLRFPDRHRLGAPVVERRRAQGALHAARRARRHPRRGRRRRAGGARTGRRRQRAHDLDLRAAGDLRPTGWTPAT